MTHHPFRDAPLHVFERVDTLDGGANYLARFYPYDTYPVFFSGKNEDAARAQAEAFRADAIAKNEASFITRQAALEKARQTRQAKKDAAE
jgi:hypothetical protein